MEGPEKTPQRPDPRERPGLLQRDPPVIPAAVLEADRLQIERQFEQVIDVDADAERERQHDVAAVQAHRLHAERGGEGVGGKLHASLGAGAGARRRPAAQMSTRPMPIHARSRNRLTSAAYTPSAGFTPTSPNSR